jgi:hypothetical protein
MPRSNNWVITVESRNDQHQEIILATIAKRAYQLFERRGYAHGFDLDDRITAERNFYRTILMGTPPNLICSSSLRQIRR